MSSIAKRAESTMANGVNTPFSTARQVMVDNQIRTFDVTDSDVLTAFETVPREVFVPAADRPLAYLDRRIDLHGNRGSRSLLPPLILARLVQALEPKVGEQALDVLGGFGYTAAILAAIGLEVTMLEADEAFSEAARLATRMLDPGLARHISISAPVIDLSAHHHGLGDAAGPFDVILLNGACEREPTVFFPLLAEGGRLGAILRKGGISRAHLFIRTGENISSRPVFDAQAPIMPGFAKEATFIF